jgi:transcriptional regulator GlxA family with amidase domain
MLGIRDEMTAVPGGLADWQLDLVVALVRRDLAAGLSVAELASRCGLSRSHFARAFKASTGLPPHRWLIKCRVERSQELLERSNDDIVEIALRCGFADQSHLTRVFHAVMGASPAAWRRQCKAGGILLPH